MARWKPAPIIGGAYSDDAKAWSCQDTLNYIPVMAERPGGRSPSLLRGVPGLVVISDLGTNAPIRGMHNVEGLLLAVSSNKLFKIGNDGAATEIGTIPGVERVSMSHNQIEGGNEVAIANGQSGYIYNTVTETLTQITDEGFPGAISFDFCDGYIMAIEPGRRFGFHSQLAAASDYNTLDRYEAEGSPDKLVGQIVTHREWWLFGERTIEPYVNTGATTGTFQRSSGTVIEIGAASRSAICQMDNSVFWLGDDDSVYRANGYTPVRISPHSIEQEISRCNSAQAFAFTYEDRGHQIFYLTFPDGHTWGYDAASGEWHRRASYGLDRWRINTLTKWRGEWVAGDYANGRLYQLDWNTQNEAGATLERRRVTGVLSDNQNPVTVNGVALVFDTGGGQQPVTNRLIKSLVITGSMPDGVIGTEISTQYTASGGVVPYASYGNASGSLPTGISISSTTGLATGTYTEIGTFTFAPSVTDAGGTIATIPTTVKVGDYAWVIVGKDATSPSTLTWMGSSSLAWDSGVSTGTTDECLIYNDRNSALYISPVSGLVYSSPDGSAWTTTGTGNPTTSGQSLAFHEDFQFRSGGVDFISRRSTGTWANPTVDSTSRANYLLTFGDTLVAASIYSNNASISADDGVTWAYGADAYVGSSNNNPALATNGARIVIAYNEATGSAYTTNLKYSDDGGSSWSSIAYTFPSPAQANYVAALAWTGSRFVASTKTGQVAYSDDGETWALSASTIGTAKQMAGIGRKVMAACGSEIYYSIDDGETWAATPLPSGSSSAYGVAWKLI